VNRTGTRYEDYKSLGASEREKTQSIFRFATTNNYGKIKVATWKKRDGRIERQTLKINDARMKREYWLYLAAAGCGAAIWIVIAAVSGRNEAWDSNLYFSVGIPAVCLVSMLFAFFEPDRSWRWGILPMVGQFVWMLVSPGPGNLLPLGVIVFAVLSVPPIIAARIAAFIASKLISFH
jgi:hypothetical protein